MAMSNSNTTLTSLWVDDAAQFSPVKGMPTTPIRGSANGTELNDDIKRFYQAAGLEPVAKEAGVIDANGDLTGFKEQVGIPRGAIQMIALPVSSSPAKLVSSPYKLDQPHLLPKPGGVHSVPSSPMILGTPQRMLGQTMLGCHTPQIITTNIQLESPQQWTAVRKRPHELVDHDFSDSKRGKKGDKGGKGLRHFSMKVCEKVQKKGVTSYNEVADELVQEFSDPRNMSPTDQAYDQKNIRRRVYDALNVLMAMNIISKEKKEIRWIGLPTNSAQECQNLEVEKTRRLERIKHKTQQLQELILQQIAFKNLVQRNRELERGQERPKVNSAIELPFIIVNTSKKTVIDCSISNDKYEYLFNFDNTFEIQDDIEVLKRMGMAYNLEKNQCTAADLQKAMRMVPQALKPYVLELAQASQPSGSIMAGPSGIKTGHSSAASDDRSLLQFKTISHASPLATPLAVASFNQDTTDVEVALATGHGLSRQSSIGSFSDIAPSRGATDTPSEYSEEGESERSSPVDIS